MDLHAIRAQLLQIVHNLDDTWTPAQLAMELGAIVTQHTGYNTGEGSCYTSLIPDAVLCAIVAEMAHQGRRWSTGAAQGRSVYAAAFTPDVVSAQSELTQVVAVGVQALINLHNQTEADLEPKASL